MFIIMSMYDAYFTQTFRSSFINFLHSVPSIRLRAPANHFYWIGLTTVRMVRASNCRPILVTRDTDDLEESVDDTSNTFSSASTGGDRVGVLVPGTWALLEPDLGEDGTGSHGGGVLSLREGECKTDGVHVGDVTVVLGWD